MARKWIQKVVHHEGRIKNYMLKKYGTQAFNKDGTLKITYLEKAKREVVKKTNNKSLISALTLAIRLKRMSKRR